MPKTYSPPALPKDQQTAVDRGEYDFLIPVQKSLLRQDEVAEVLDRSTQFVGELIDRGRLEAHRDHAFGAGLRKSNRVTRRSLILYLAETSNYDPAYMVMRIEVVLKTLKTPQLDRLIAFAHRQKNLVQ